MKIAGRRPRSRLSLELAGAKANSTWKRFSVERHLNPLAAELDRLLAADAFDSDAIAAFATRTHYPDAADFLLERCILDGNGRAPFIFALRQPFDHYLTPFRLAMALGGILRLGRTSRDQVDAGTILKLTRSHKKEIREKSFAVLAALGNPARSWKVASRRERAALCLGYLVRAMP